MNTNVKTELAAVAATQSAVDAMAVVTLSPEKYAAEVYQPFKSRLVDAIDSVKAIDYDIKTTAGMAVAIKARATFRDLRIDADKERKARKEPITKIGKLLESGFDLVEERIAPLEDLFDADIKTEEARKEAEKAAKIAVERARTEAIQADIDRLRAIPAALIGKSSDDLAFARKDMLIMTVDEARFAEFTETARTVVSDIISRIELMLTAEIEREKSALAAEEARKAEALRIDQERATLAAQRIEQERVANEQAAAAKRLADQEAAQALAAKVLADKAAANLRDEREAQELAMRLEREAVAEQQRQLDEQQAQIAADRAALVRMQSEAAERSIAAARLEVDHAEALEMNALLDAAHARLDADSDKFTSGADLARCNATVASLLADNLPPPESCCARDARIDSGEEDGPGDEDIIEFGKEWDLDLPSLVVRMERFVVDQRELAEVADALPGGQHYSTTTFKDNGEPILLNADGTRSIFCDLDD